MTAPRAQAVVLAAGKGTRLRSSSPKVLQPALGEPLLEHVLRAVNGAGADPVTVVVGHGAEAVERAFAGRELRFVRQDPPRGTGHALQVAAGAIAEHPERTVVVANGDVPLLSAETLLRLLDLHQRDGACATILSAHLSAPGAYGRVLRDATGQVLRIVEACDANEEQAAVDEVNAGLYAFDVQALQPTLHALRPHNAQGEYYLTDVIGLLTSAGRHVAALRLEDAEEMLGVNTLAELADVGRRMRRRRCETLMAAGVRIEDPATTAVGAEVVVEPGAVLHACSILQGRSVVERGAEVGPFARLDSSRVEAGARVLDHSLVVQSVVESGASVGPFAHLRPGSRVGRGARVGNFVEMKKTHLGEGSKASHLSYLGDALIGPRVNIGAGTITCNYDGVAKHATQIDEEAFVGSNSALVAPVRVGAGAYVAAGSTITRDVPPGALGVGRARQELREGYAERRKRRKGPGGKS